MCPAFLREYSWAGGDYSPRVQPSEPTASGRHAPRVSPTFCGTNERRSLIQFFIEGGCVMKAGLYIRVSSDRQAKEGESLAEQEATLQAYCNFRDIAIATIYKEEGRSGKDTNRPQFQRMIKDCQLGKIDTVIVKKVDRLSRSLIDFEKTIKFFEDNNVNLISLNENFDTSTAIGRAVIRIILTFAQLEREQTSERTVDVMKFRAEQGQWNGGYPPLGYDYDKELGLIINTEEAKIVRIIFDKYIELASYRKVAEFLNTAGHRTKKFTNRLGQETGGNEFGDTSVAAILKNSIYTGKIKYKEQTYSGKHQAIITEDLFNQAQSIMNRNNQRNVCIKKVNKHNFLLEGLIRCGECGAVMAPKWSLSHGRRYFYYECTTLGHKGKDACGVKAISAPALESLVLRIIRKIRKDDILFNQIITGNKTGLKKEIDQMEGEKILLNFRLSELSKKATAIVEKLLSMPELSHSQLLCDEVGKIEKEKADIAKQIEEIDFKISQYKNRFINTDLAKRSLQYFSQVYLGLDINGKKNLIQLLIKEITFNNKQISINFYDYIDVSSAEGAGGRAVVGNAYNLARRVQPVANTTQLTTT